ncbi:MAG TPA: hypothetical protein DEA96_04745, partial [Leptospiraceae bacterium]|nr:hypothetical protein [Leptospiraceae bacterium]
MHIGTHSWRLVPLDRLRYQRDNKFTNIMKLLLIILVALTSILQCVAHPVFHMDEEEANDSLLNTLLTASSGGLIFGFASLDCSDDGQDWTAGPASELSSWSSVTYGNGLFVAVADFGTNRVMTSPNGINWTSRTAAENNFWRSVTFANGIFVSVTDSGTN